MPQNNLRVEFSVKFRGQQKRIDHGRARNFTETNMFNTLQEGPFAHLKGKWIFAFIRGSKLFCFLPSSFFVLFVAFVVKHWVAASGCSKRFVVDVFFSALPENPAAEGAPKKAVAWYPPDTRQRS